MQVGHKIHPLQIGKEEILFHILRCAIIDRAGVGFLKLKNIFLVLPGGILHKPVLLGQTGIPLDQRGNRRTVFRIRFTVVIIKL